MIIIDVRKSKYLVAKHKFTMGERGYSYIPACINQSINQSPLMLNYRAVRVKESQVYYIIKYIKKQKNVRRELMHDLASQ